MRRKDKFSRFAPFKTVRSAIKESDSALPLKPKNAALVFAAVLTAVGAALIFAQKHDPQTAAVHKKLFAMDTICDISVYPAKSGDEQAEKTADSCAELIQQLDGKFSAYYEQSDIYRLNSGEALIPDKDTAEIISLSAKLTKLYPDADCSCGALTKLWNVTERTGDQPLPDSEQISEALSAVGQENIIFAGDGSISLKKGTRLDLGCCAKGYALDKVKQTVGDECMVISFGSSLLLNGSKPDGEKFNIQVADPENTASAALTLHLDECFLSTSGGYERYFEYDGKKYCHILDLSTGYPAESDIISATVITKDSGIKSDMLSTCVFIGGTKKLDGYLADEDISVIAIDKNKLVYCSDNIKNNVETANDSYKFADHVPLTAQ